MGFLEHKAQEQAPLDRSIIAVAAAAAAGAAGTLDGPSGAVSGVTGERRVPNTLRGRVCSGMRCLVRGSRAWWRVTPS